MLAVAPHPTLDLEVLEARWPCPLDQLPPADWMRPLVHAPAPEVPFEDPAELLAGPHKTVVRDLLRVGGFKPAGRDKPCWEYLAGVAAKGRFPWINPPVDATNLAALRGGLPVSTVDADRLEGALAVRIAEAGTRIVFNQSGQELDVGGLVCLFDAQGPVADAVKDCQRTKTDGQTTRTLTVIWGSTALPGRADAVARWQTALFERCGAVVHRLPTES